MAVEQLVGGASEPMLRWLEYACGFVVLAHERDRDVSRPCFDRQAHFQPGISRLHVHLPLGISLILSDEALGSRSSLGLAADGEPLEQRAVQSKLNLVRIAHPDDVVVQLSAQQHFYRVLAIDGKVMANDGAALRPERKIVSRAVVLYQCLGNLVRVHDRDDGAIADSEATDPRSR
jgi:hypothetical protein